MKVTRKNVITRILALVLAVMAVLTALPFGSIVASAATTYNGGYGITVGEMTVYSDAACTTYKGKLYDNESFTVLNKISNSVFNIEYSTSNGPKEGYIRVDNDWNSIQDRTSNSCVAVAKAATNVYYGNSSSTYLRAGSVSAGERVVVVSKYGSWAYIEYNTNSGRKRGFVASSSLTYYNEPSSYGDFFLDNYADPDAVGNSYTVYAGPTYRYAAVGSVSAEDVILYGADNGGYFIVYSVSGSSQLKSGFIFIG